MNAKDLYWPIFYLSIFKTKKIIINKMFVIELRYYIAHNNIILPSLIISIGVSSVSKHKVRNPKKRVIDRFKSFQFSILRPLSSLTWQYSPLPIQLDQKSLQRSIHPSSTVQGSLESRISSTELQYFQVKTNEDHDK